MTTPRFPALLALAGALAAAFPWPPAQLPQANMPNGSNRKWFK